MSKVAIITGATRGIGRELAHGLAKNGYNIVVTGKTMKDSNTLPGTIYSVAEEIERYGVIGAPIRADLRNTEDIDKIVRFTRSKFGRLDLLINNAGALFWKPIIDTDIKKYDLINNINSRASFYLSKLCLPLLKESGGGHIINQSPPLLEGDLLNQTLKGKTAYMISKWGMTLGALGIAEEYRGTGIACNTIWPMTPIESYAVKNNNLGNEKMWRKPDIIVDSVLEIIKEDPNVFTGNQLIDEVYLREKGVTDFSKYQCVEGFEPPKLMEINEMWKS
jgi:citronellol/citronellal dehydrogenase